ncbi:MAG: cell surface protein SprA [Bacteroidales bacterium]|nr:cell surface protein SprA [Bacteroidales bacterium]
MAHPFVSRSQIDLSEPSNVVTSVEYDEKNNEYVLVKRIGSLIIERKVLSFEEYQHYDMDKMISDYWKNRSNSSNISSNSISSADGGLSELIPALKINSELFETIFGGQEITPRLNGSAEITMGIVNNYQGNLALQENQRSTTNFKFDETIQLNASVQIGTATSFNLNYNTEATFDFENEMKLKWEGKEDDILQLIEAGNISFPLPTTLIQGSQNLFGVKTKLKFGNLLLDAVAAQQKSESNNITLQGGSQIQEFQVKADEYDENRHYFIAQYFYDHYNEAMATMPLINSNVNIIKIEVWRTNIGAAVTENRNIIAFSDLGEIQPYATIPGLQNPYGSILPDGKTSNNLYSIVNINSIRNINVVSSYLQSLGFTAGQTYEKVESARKLSSSEYTFNPRLGFISLNQSLSADQVLAVAFRYQIIGDTTTYQVGEFSDEGIADPNTLVVKLLKSSSLNVKNPIWKLMMKNAYSLNIYGVQSDGFRLNILYQGDEDGIMTGYFNEGSKKGIPLLQVFGLDKMDNQQNPYPDGVFDFIPFSDAGYSQTSTYSQNSSSQSTMQSGGGTIKPDKAIIFFPYVEPFGNDLRKILNDNELADKYCFDSLYTLTKIQAKQYPDKDKYYLEGRCSSSSSNEISIGPNVPQGSVRVMAGGITLTEGVDYTVDYAMGRVRIINQGYLNSGTPISVSTESNNTFSANTKWMFGARANYIVNEDFNLGLTILNLHETPSFRKANYGEEPSSNSLWGFDFNYRKDIPFITKLIDLLPFYQTKAPSTLTLTGEFAQFLPNNPSVIGSSGTAYLDDFEAAKQSRDLKTIGNWFLASTPQDYKSVGAMFPETQPNSGLMYGFNRAKVAWYSIDNNFYDNPPSNITKNDLSQTYARQLLVKEIYPNKQQSSSELQTLREFNFAFYPSERGPYNYDITSSYSSGLNPDGSLKNPKTRWGGIMRKLEVTDFEAANIEYIEFWLLDPFRDDTINRGGKLYFNLGDISEDILRDGRKSFENGLPTTAVVVDVDTTIWGRVPRLQSIVNAFSNDPEARQYQDIGYDGLNSTDEASFFSDFMSYASLNLNAEAYNTVLNDPSADDFKYFRNSEFDNADVKIVERYKFFNNAEANSRAANNSSDEYGNQSSSLPNVEDINQDNTLSEAENYYEYVIYLAPEKMIIGENYITDKQTSTVTLPNEQDASYNWYQFKIPVRNPDKIVGDISGYQSIRFMRMFLRDFEEPIILRFGTFELVAADWRKYTDNLFENGIYTPPQTDNTKFTIASVNIEENGKRFPVPYNLPPGIEREDLLSGTTNVLANEQALSIKIENLADGDARAIYKTTEFDMRQYGKLKMFVHAEKMYEQEDYNTGELSLFLRIGTDFTNNYYEYELPLSFTTWGTSFIDKEAIWPEKNNIDIDLERLVKVKENRNAQIRGGSSNVAISLPYYEYVDGKKMSVVGSPNIGSVKVIMIGVRNPKKKNINDNDDMLPKSAELWINELRLTDFNRSSGWAATGFARTNLADLGDLSISGSYRSAGFGSLEQKVSEVSLDNIGTFDIATNLELGKFFPDKTGIRLPLHFDYSQSVSNPRYNPLDPDVYLANDLMSYRTEAERDSIRHIVQDYVSRTNINFMNVKKDRVGEGALKQHIWDIENWDASYSYSNMFARDIDVTSNTKLQHRGTLNYQFNPQVKPWKPFGKISALNKKVFAIIRDISISYIPKTLSFRTEMVRDYEETLLRAKSKGDIIMSPYYYKQFYWNRAYKMQWDLTSNIKLDYDATMNALIEEPRGKIDTKEQRDSVWSSVLDLGRAQQYTQNFKVNVTVPINKIPIFDFMRLTGSYGGKFIFTGSMPAMDSIGSSVENERNIQINGTFNFTTLYNKIPVIKKAYDAQKKDDSRKGMMPKRPVMEREIKNPKDSINKNTSDTTESKLQKLLKEVSYASLRFLTSVKSFNVSYNLREGTYIPGFMPRSKWLGADVNNNFAPGFGFIFGSQDNIMDKAANEGWITTNSLMNNAYWNKQNETLNGSIKIEPLKDFSIDLSFMRNQSEQTSSYYKYNDLTGRIEGPLSPNSLGNYSISLITIGTLFTGMDDNNVSPVFEQFMNNRIIIAQRLAQNNPQSNGNILDTITGQFFPTGYSPIAQQVLIPSFLAAYIGTDPNSQSLNPFLQIPLPNWRMQYTGLGKIKLLQKWVTSITITSNYSSKYTIGSYHLDSRVPLDENYDIGKEWIVFDASDPHSNFIPRNIIDQVVIAEQFSPLIKIDINLKNSLQTNFEFSKERNVSASFSNLQLTEINSTNVVVGAGYRFKDVSITIRTGANLREFKSDILLKADFSWRTNKTILRKIDQNVNLVSSGSEVMSLSFSGEYSLTEKIVLRAFFEMVVNTPYVSNSYPNSTTQGGFALRITL